MSRKFPKSIKRIVIKIGSSAIADGTFKPNKRWLRSLVTQIKEIRRQKIQVILVSSGAIVLGMGEMNLRVAKRDLSTLQALAAIGQTILMKTYSELFKKVNIKCAQLLLTWDDFDNRRRNNNARRALNAILEKGVVPIINENDTVSTEEIEFGDNDKLSAFVASFIHADLLLMLTDVEGLYDFTDGKKKLFKEVKEITRDIEGIASGPSKGKISKGGMSAKLEAIKIAVPAKIPCIIANRRTKNVLTRILKGEPLGTYFVEKENKILARKHWIAFQAKPKGALVVDEGARKALLEGGRSLLLPGIVVGEGHFKKGDVVIVRDKNHHEIARGMINYSSQQLTQIEDKKGKLEAIHRNDLVLCER